MKVQINAPHRGRFGNLAAEVDYDLDDEENFLVLKGYLERPDLFTVVEEGEVEDEDADEDVDPNAEAKAEAEAEWQAALDEVSSDEDPEATTDSGEEE